jgi:hypothetical protein
MGPSLYVIASLGLQFLADNPELYHQLLLSNPAFQKLIAANPELRHALADPSTLQQVLRAAADPAAQAELMRGHDRALANLETFPEGFGHLRRIYETMQVPLYEALEQKPASTRTETEKLAKDQADSKNTQRSITTQPVPNPWAPPPKPDPMHMSAFHAVQTQGKHPSPPMQMFPVMHSFMQPSTHIPAFIHVHPSSTASPSSPKELFAAQLAAMHALGFTNDDTENIPALLATSGHVQAAIDRILAQRK